MELAMRRLCVHVNSQHYVESERPSPVGLYKIESKHDLVTDHVVHLPTHVYCVLYQVRPQAGGGAFPALKALSLV
jgi:hypothetical protein